MLSDYLIQMMEFMLLLARWTFPNHHSIMTLLPCVIQTVMSMLCRSGHIFGLQLRAMHYLRCLLCLLRVAGTEWVGDFPICLSRRLY